MRCGVVGLPRGAIQAQCHSASQHEPTVLFLAKYCNCNTAWSSHTAASLVLQYLYMPPQYVLQCINRRVASKRCAYPSIARSSRACIPIPSSCCRRGLGDAAWKRQSRGSGVVSSPSPSVLAAYGVLSIQSPEYRIALYQIDPTRCRRIVETVFRPHSSRDSSPRCRYSQGRKDWVTSARFEDIVVYVL